jgi:tRNA A-37 threonylcarbamoyl transferase component Bud32
MAEAKTAQLRAAFKACDQTGNGRLGFEEFFALLKKGNPRFDEPQARDLFEKSDQDMSGEVDFDEFVDYIFNNAGMDVVFKLEASAQEEECKQTLLSKPGLIRAAASKAVKDRGENWRDLTWKQRLDEVREIEGAQKEESVTRSVGAPTHDPSSALKAPVRRPERKRTEISPKSPMKPKEQTRPKTSERRASVNAQNASVSLLGAGLPKGLNTNKFAIAEMSQAELVAYSLQDDDLAFAGDNAEVKEDLSQFRTYLKSAESPLDTLEVMRFIAKGTAGWVFLAENKQSGARCAMKLIRMTQARSGIKEWFCSKSLKKVNVSNIVFTDEVVKVVSRAQAPAVIQKELANAGPVNFFMAMIQELMPWGTLEDLAKEGELSPEIMFKCLEDVSQTLAVMHANNLQHRDVKPENIMLQMDEDDNVVAAKLCDFGSAMVGDDQKSCADDIRRFGVTLFSVATGEGWTKNRLIREKHENLVSRLAVAVEGSGDPSMRRLPEVLEQILSGSMTMADVASVMEELADCYDD